MDHLPIHYCKVTPMIKDMFWHLKSFDLLQNFGNQQDQINTKKMNTRVSALIKNIALQKDMTIMLIMSYYTILTFILDVNHGLSCTAEKSIMALFSIVNNKNYWSKSHFFYLLDYDLDYN
jgi:hypothetical protein